MMKVSLAVLLITALIGFGSNIAIAQEWSTLEALKAFGKPGDTIRGSSEVNKSSLRNSIPREPSDSSDGGGVTETILNNSSADEKSHYMAALNVVKSGSYKRTYHDNCMKGSLLGLKDGHDYENDPKTKPYSFVIINAAKEVFEKFCSDSQIMNKIINRSAQIFMQEFTEDELQELAKYYGTNSKNKAALTEVGRNAVLKLPEVNQKLWGVGSQQSMPPKYEKLLINKIKNLQNQGKLPHSFN